MVALVKLLTLPSQSGPGSPGPLWIGRRETKLVDIPL
jgi:hypothetical protein